MANSLSMITLVVPDYDEAIAFFIDGLGFTLVSDEDQGRKRWVVVASPGQGSQILLARASDTAQRTAIGNQTGGRVGFFLQTDDFDASARAIVAAGGRLTEVPRQEPYGKVVIFCDPWGNLWDLIAPTP